MTLWHTLLAGGAAIGGLLLYRRWQLYRRRQFIRNYRLPAGLIQRLQKRRPGLSRAQCQQVDQALRQFFLAYLNGGRKFVSMPSQVTDELWHEFILYTRHYQQFCRQAFGRFLHHTPAVVLSADKRDNTGLRRCWSQCCKLDDINPRQALVLPLLFAIDSQLGIADGFHYLPDCSALREDGSSGGGTYCGGDFSDSSFDGCTDGLDCDSDGGGSDGDGGGDGGGGCGGGD